MDNNHYNQILQKIDGLFNQVESQQVKRLELDLLKRITIRLLSFDCSDCTDYLSEVEHYVDYLEIHKKMGDKQQLKEYRKLIGAIKAHLQKEHGLVPEGYYMSIYMSIGMSIGLVLGLTIFDHLALGLPIGLSVGLAVGSGIDALYAKKGMTI